jgi:hypothetical protein
MKSRKGWLEFGINCLADLRILYKAWDRLWALEDPSKTDTIMVYVTMDDRLPEEQVALHFQASPEVLDRYLSILEQDGLRFTRREPIRGFLTMCRVEKDRGGSTVIGANGRHDCDIEPEGCQFCDTNQRE